MCLSRLTPDVKPRGIAYKIFRKMDGGQIGPYMFAPQGGPRLAMDDGLTYCEPQPIPVGVELTAVENVGFDRATQYGLSFNDDGGHYPFSFHCFATREVARDYIRGKRQWTFDSSFKPVIHKVRIREALCGEYCGVPAVVARKMTILERVR